MTAEDIKPPFERVPVGFYGIKKFSKQMWRKYKLYLKPVPHSVVDMVNIDMTMTNEHRIEGEGGGYTKKGKQRRINQTYRIIRCVP